MIVTHKVGTTPDSFESLLSTSTDFLVEEAKKTPNYFHGRTGLEFEEDVFGALDTVAKGSIFENSIELISGHKFPDLVVEDIYGVEVKTNQKDNWKSTGNSVLESTRIESVESIYLFFARLKGPIQFMFRPYQDCLYDVAVTHSPRYLIDMKLGTDQSIFNKMGIDYNDLRKLENPIKPVVDYYRSIATKGEEPWWMGSEVAMKPTVTLWSNLTREEHLYLKIEAFARFPEIFSTRQDKYHALASWLVARHGVVDPSLRDRFSAGGRYSVAGKSRKYVLPKVYRYLEELLSRTLDVVKKLDFEDAKHYWELSETPQEKDLPIIWKGKIIEHSRHHDGQVVEFVEKLFAE
jgi:hypothetical protein